MRMWNWKLHVLCTGAHSLCNSAVIESWSTPALTVVQYLGITCHIQDAIILHNCWGVYNIILLQTKVKAEIFQRKKAWLVMPQSWKGWMEQQYQAWWTPSQLAQTSHGFCWEEPFERGLLLVATAQHQVLAACQRVNASQPQLHPIEASDTFTHGQMVSQSQNKWLHWFNRKQSTNKYGQNQYICLIRIKKSPFSQFRKSKARLTLLQQATENSKEAKTKQRTNDQETKTKKTKLNMKAVWTVVSVSCLFRDQEQWCVW
jgi:hypothetical protein